jgi:hypothetical protein
MNDLIELAKKRNLGPFIEEDRLRFNASVVWLRISGKETSFNTEEANQFLDLAEALSRDKTFLDKLVTRENNEFNVNLSIGPHSKDEKYDSSSIGDRPKDEKFIPFNFKVTGESIASIGMKQKCCNIVESSSSYIYKDQNELED